MQSLRTRKPSEHRPQGQARPGNRLAKSGPRDARKSTRVDDKIKKRMSMRYVDISSPTEASIPAVPLLPLNLRPGHPKSQGELIQESGQVREDPKVADLKVLDKDDFDPDACECSPVAVRSMLLRSDGFSLKGQDGQLDGG